MQKPLSDMILITDLDNTLLPDSLIISDNDLRGIEKLRSLGGDFTFATGRSHPLALPQAKALGIQEPAIIYNGAVVYDFGKDEYLWSTSLPDTSRHYVKEVLDKFPDVAIEVLIGKEVHVIRSNEYELQHIKRENIKFTESSLDDLPDGWTKVLFPQSPGNVDKFAEFMFELNATDVTFVSSSPIFFEMLPSNISKSTAVTKMLELTGRKDKKVYAVGDYYNDLEMIRDADVGFAVADAPEEVRAVADVVVARCDDGGFAEVINYIISEHNK